MCYYNGQKVTRSEFIKLKALEKAVSKYNFLNVGVHNGFNYAPCAILLQTEDGKDFEILQAEWGYVPGFVKTRAEANIFRKKYTTLNFKAENLFVREDGKRSMWAEAAKTVLQVGKVVQGIGNAYVDEILYAANLSPFSIAGRIPEKKITLLTKAIKQVLTDAEAHIRKKFPDTITEKERDFLKVHLPKHKLTPMGETILVTEIAKRKTYYTEGQELFE